jgi:nucleoside-diphosphate-sugar epimerase
MKLFLTGATGFIGGRLARRLRAGGHELTALVRTPAKAADLAALGIALAPGDVTDAASVKAAMRGAERVYHVAAWYKVGARDRSMAWAINVEGTRNVLQAMRELGVAKGVYTSTLAAFGDTHGQVVDETHRPRVTRWLSEYDRTKSAAHFQVALPMMESGLPLVIVQPGVNYGPGDTSMVRELFIQYLKGRLPMIPRGMACCWAHVEDTVTGHVQAMERGRVGETYIIAGPCHTYVEAIEAAERITGIRAPRIRPGPGTLRAVAAIMGVVEKLIPVPESYAAETFREMAGTTYLGTHEKARRELGFDPRPLEVGLRETLEHEMRLLGIAPRRAPSAR